MKLWVLACCLISHVGNAFGLHSMSICLISTQKTSDGGKVHRLVPATVKHYRRVLRKEIVVTLKQTENHNHDSCMTEMNTIYFKSPSLKRENIV